MEKNVLSYNISISEEDYKPFQELENLTGEECYQKFGLKCDEGHGDNFVLDNRFTIYLSQTVTFQEELTTQAYASLEDKWLDKWYDCFECDDTVLGEWWFTTADDEEVYIDIGLH